MASTHFISKQTVITADWANDVDAAVYEKLPHVVMVTDYGAVGDWSTDSTAAFEQAATVLAAAGGGTLHIPAAAGAYRVTRPLSFLDSVVRIIGDGPQGSVIYVDHASGPAITIGRYFSGIKNVRVQGSAARLAAAAGTNYGIYFPTDSLLAQSRFANYVSGCIIQNHSSHGIFATGQGMIVEDTRIFDIGEHGFYGDNFDADPNYLFGFSEIRNTQILRCAGHGVCVGNNRAGFRFTMDNVDVFHCARTAGVRLSLFSTHIVAENLIARNCGFGGWSGDSPSRVATVGGIYVDGRSPRIECNRFIDVKDYCVVLGQYADGATILDNHIVGEVQADLNPAVWVTPGVTGVYVRWGFPAHITTVMSAAPVGSGNRCEAYDVSPQGVRSTLNAYTIADDAVHEVEFEGAVWGVALFSTNSSTTDPFMVAFRTGDAFAYCKLMTTASNVNVTTGVLTGTTGSDGKVTVSVNTADSVLYIENRMGAQHLWRPTFLSLYGGELKVI